MTNRRRVLQGVAMGAALALAGCAVRNANPDLVEVAQASPDFETLVAAVVAADLVETLKGPGPFTVFAPTDAAFSDLPSGTLETLLKPENKEKLAALLTYHVVSGRVLAEDLAGQRSRVPTVNGQTVHVDGRSGVRVNGANVVTPNIEASNGVIHVIDRVLLP